MPAPTPIHYQGVILSGQYILGEVVRGVSGGTKMQPLCGPFSFRLFLPTLLSGVATGQLAFRPAHGHIDVSDRRMLKDHVAGSHPLS